jgi:hypothetical protein
MNSSILSPDYIFTSNSLAPAGLPLREISTLYFPAGQSLGFAMWNSLAAGPVGAIVCVSSLITVSPS